MTERVKLGSEWINHYGCRDCGQVWWDKDRSKMPTTLRPNNKYCNPDCMRFVLQKKAVERYAIGALARNAVKLKLPDERLIRED